MLPNEKINVLLAEDDPDVRNFLQIALRNQRYAVKAVGDGEEAMTALANSESNFSVVLLDLFMPRKNGFETLQEIRRGYQDLPVILLSGEATRADLVHAMKNGAADFLTKPISHSDLDRAITSVLDLATIPGGVLTPEIPIRTQARTAVTGTDPATAQIVSLIPQVGRSEVPVLIQGETGAGKEVLARELHSHSSRAGKPFLKLNCAALPHELVESELFGYERGAFTGAFQRKLGVFDLAKGGTLLLDEIGDMDIRLQAKLLQVLQDQEFMRLGGKETIRVDVRIMAATHRNLEEAVEDGSFRQDLYFRLNVVSFRVPALRERRQDLFHLARVLLEKHISPEIDCPEITPALRAAMLSHSWPGNIRELENVMRKLAVLGDGDRVAAELRVRPIAGGPVTGSAPVVRTVEPKATPGEIPATPKHDSSVLRQVSKAMQEAEMEAILGALNSTRWNRKEAASLLQIEYKALLYKMKKLAIGSRFTGIDTSAARARA